MGSLLQKPPASWLPNHAGAQPVHAFTGRPPTPPASLLCSQPGPQLLTSEVPTSPQCPSLNPPARGFLEQCGQGPPDPEPSSYCWALGSASKQGARV